MADLRAIINCHRSIIRPLSHHLQRCSAAAGNCHAHEAIAHREQRWLDSLTNAVCVDQETEAFCPCFPNRSGSAESAETPCSRTSRPKQKVGRRPTRNAARRADPMSPYDIMSGVFIARAFRLDHPANRGRRLARRKAGDRPARRAFSSYRVDGQSRGRSRQSNGRRANHSNPG